MAFAAQQIQSVVLHGLADAMDEEPCRLRGQAVPALDLAGRRAVLVRRHLEDDHDPRPDRDLRAVHDRPGRRRELLAALGALLQPP
jgi:hypothetical protein